MVRPIEVATLDIALQGEHNSDFYFAAGLDRPYYYSVHSAAAELAPAGNTLLHVAKYLAAEGPESTASEAELEHLLHRLNPGWQQKLIHKRFLPHVRAANRLASASAGGLAGRQAVCIDGLERTFLAGDWVGAQGWLADSSVASALLAAEQVLQNAPTRAQMLV